jgi:hypothetical protein
LDFAHHSRKHSQVGHELAHRLLAELHARELEAVRFGQHAEAHEQPGDSIHRAPVGP